MFNYFMLPVYGLVVLYAAYVILKALGISSRFSKAKVETPIISSHQMLNGGSLHSVHKGMFSGFSYNLLTNDAGRVMVLVDLGHNTGLHLIAVGDKSRIDPMITVQINSRFLERIVLEGDFPSYFRIYVTPGKQIEVRQVMEPKNMAQFVDFCRSYSVEIFRGSMYISQAQNVQDDADSTVMTKDLEDFLRENGTMLRRL